MNEQLKSAEEWLKEADKSDYDNLISYKNSFELVQQIQLNAVRYGMTLAAGIVNDARGEGEPDLRCIRSEIEFARDKLTIGDLK